MADIHLDDTLPADNDLARTWPPLMREMRAAVNSLALLVAQGGGGGSPLVTMEIDASDQDTVANLPDGGQVYVCKKDDTEHKVIITPAAGKSVAFNQTLELDMQGQGVTLILIGTNWYVQ